MIGYLLKSSDVVTLDRDASEGAIGSLFSLGWAGGGLVLLLLASLFVAAAAIVNGAPRDIGMSNWRVWLGGVVAILVVGLMLSRSISMIPVLECPIEDVDPC